VKQIVTSILGIESPLNIIPSLFQKETKCSSVLEIVVMVSVVLVENLDCKAKGRTKVFKCAEENI
jgi:hypothetical protein